MGDYAIGECQDFLCGKDTGEVQATVLWFTLSRAHGISSSFLSGCATLHYPCGLHRHAPVRPPNISTPLHCLTIYPATALIEHQDGHCRQEGGCCPGRPRGWSAILGFLTSPSTYPNPPLYTLCCPHPFRSNWLCLSHLSSLFSLFKCFRLNLFFIKQDVSNILENASRLVARLARGLLDAFECFAKA